MNIDNYSAFVTDYNAQSNEQNACDTFLSSGSSSNATTLNITASNAPTLNVTTPNAPTLNVTTPNITTSSSTFSREDIKSKDANCIFIVLGEVSSLLVNYSRVKILKKPKEEFRLLVQLQLQVLERMST